MLVIDDSLAARMKTKAILESDGIEVLLATTPEEGSATDEREAPDVILLDVVLPGIDGIELCQSWRKNARLCEIPVLLMSGERSERDDRAAGLRAGAMGYVVKPFNRPELLAQVHLLQQLAISHRELKHQAQLARAANATKSRFLANMSHEIRTPLTSVLGYAETLLDPLMPVCERESAVRTIVRNGKHLLEVLNDILDISKIEAGKLVVEAVDCSPFQIITEVATLTQLKAEEKGLEFSLHFNFPIPRRIKTDPTRLKQILVNLVGNAIKFTERGRVAITCSFSMETEKMVIAVSDSGIGISAEQATKLFHPFSQADDSTVREFGGTGLGLAISRELAERLAGKIEIHSKVGRGSTFRVEVASGEIEAIELVNELPAAKSGNGEAPIIDEKLRGHVLIVDDEEDIRQLLAYLLGKVGVTSEFAVNGKRGVELAATGAFDLILMDVQMPVMDGYAAIRELRSRSYEGPIIALTGNAMSDDVARLLTSGCNEHLSKPFERREFLITIGRYIGGVGRQSRALSLADDDPEFAKITVRFLAGLDERCQAITDAAANFAWDELENLSHKLAGAALYGFDRLSQIGVSLEVAAKERNCETVTALVPVFHDEIAQALRTKEEIVRRSAP